MLMSSLGVLRRCMLPVLRACVACMLSLTAMAVQPSPLVCIPLLTGADARELSVPLHESVGEVQLLQLQV